VGGEDRGYLKDEAGETCPVEPAKQLRFGGQPVKNRDQGGIVKGGGEPPPPPPTPPHPPKKKKKKKQKKNPEKNHRTNTEKKKLRFKQYLLGETR